MYERCDDFVDTLIQFVRFYPERGTFFSLSLSRRRVKLKNKKARSFRSSVNGRCSMGGHSSNPSLNKNNEVADSSRAELMNSINFEEGARRKIGGCGRG